MKLNKKQKRTATIASMAALLAVVLGMGGQTFAKYISTQDVAATATVAKWGVVINTDVTNLWGKTYGAKQSNGSLLASANTDSVVTTGASSVVAPGTTGYMTFSAEGSPEVKSQITFDVIDTYQELELSYSGSDTPYYPIEWTLEDTSTTTPKTIVDGGRLSEVVTAIEKLGTNDGARITNAANTSFKYSYKLTWNWDFDTDTTSNVNDYRDAALGNMIAGDTNIDPNERDAETYDKSKSKTQIIFGLTITVAQVQ